MKKISPARRAAFDILLRIDREKAFSSVLLPDYEASLSSKDASLCHTLTLGVLRRKMFIDRIIAHFADKKIEKLDPEVLTALRLGIFQMLYLDRIPDFSAINESVNLVYAAKKRSAAGFTNAILRKVSRHGEFRFEYQDELERVSIETSHPRWLIEQWTGQFGFEKASSIADANNRESALSFRLTKKFHDLEKEKRAEVLQVIAQSGATASDLTENSITCSSSSETLFKLASDGLIYFQDEGSQIVAAASLPLAGEAFFDVCAAPGSKASMVAALARKSPPVIIVAGDFHDHRVRFLRDNLGHQGVENCAVVQYDAGDALPFPEQSFDVVLLDAPCSGTGTIKNNPEIRYFLERKDLTELAGKQLEFLKNASKVVKSGGRLVYSTCSLEVEENEQVIESFLRQSANFEKVLPDVSEEFLTEAGFARTDPSAFSLDGFFICELRRSR